MVLKPQALAQQVLHRPADGIFVIAGDRLDFFAGGAQPGFERIGGVQHRADRMPAGMAALADPPRRHQADSGGDDQQEQEGFLHGASLQEHRACGKHAGAT